MVDVRVSPLSVHSQSNRAAVKVRSDYGCRYRITVQTARWLPGSECAGIRDSRIEWALEKTVQEEATTEIILNGYGAKHTIEDINN